MGLSSHQMNFEKCSIILRSVSCWLNHSTNKHAVNCNSRLKSCRKNVGRVCTNLSYNWCPRVVLPTGPSNEPAVQIWTSKTGQFSYSPVQKPDLLTLGGPNPDLYPSTHGFRWVCLDPSVPITGSAFRVSHSWSHSDMLLLIVKHWHWYITVHVAHISRLDVQNKHSHVPNHILKMSVHGASTIFGLASSVIWVVLDHKHP